MGEYLLEIKVDGCTREFGAPSYHVALTTGISILADGPGIFFVYRLCPEAAGVKRLLVSYKQ